MADDGATYKEVYEAARLSDQELPYLLPLMFSEWSDDVWFLSQLEELFSHLINLTQNYPPDAEAIEAREFISLWHARLQSQADIMLSDTTITELKDSGCL